MSKDDGGLWRAGLGALLMLHALAHARTALWAAGLGTWWAPGPGETMIGSMLLQSLWILALAGFAASGLGAWGVWPFKNRWTLIGGTAACASIALLAATQPPGAPVGLVIDALVVLLIWRARSPFPWNGANGRNGKAEAMGRPA